MKKINIFYILLTIAFFTNAMVTKAQVAGITQLSLVSYDSATPTPNIIDTDVIGDGSTPIQSYEYYADPLVIESNGIMKTDIFYEAPSPGQTVYLRIWLDANGNGVFEASEILISTSSSTGVFFPSPNIPVLAPDVELMTMQFIMYDDSNYTNEISNILLSVVEFGDPPPLIIHTSGKEGIVTFEEEEEYLYCLPIDDRIVFLVKYEFLGNYNIERIELNGNEVEVDDYTRISIAVGENEHPRDRFIIDIDPSQLSNINRLDCIASNGGTEHYKGIYFTLGCCPTNTATYNEYNPPFYHTGASDRISLGTPLGAPEDGGLLQIQTNEEYSFQAVNEIEFHPGVEIEGDEMEDDGFLFAYIHPCVDVQGNNSRVQDTNDQKTFDHLSSLYKVSPNPFSDQVTISYSLLEKDVVNLNLYNVNGQMIKQLVVDKYQVDFNEVQLDTSTLPQGTYFMKLQLGQSIYTKKIVKL